MSKQKNEDQLLKDQPDLTPAPGEISAEDNPQNGNPGPAVLTIEEHAERLHIDKPVFAAVVQSKKWASGKKVPEVDFKKAVEGFLSAPMGGTK